jgi:hypothetical protein
MSMTVSNPQTWGPEEGLEPRFDCPDCSYARTGMTVSRHAFKRHLYTEHEYTVEEADRLSLGGQ